MAKMTEEQKAERRAARKAKQELDRLTGMLRREKRDCLRNMLPEPSWKAEIGDRVKYGAWNWTAVLETFRGSKMYKLISITRHTNRNRSDYSSLKIHYEPWYNVRPYRDFDEWDDIQRFEQDDDIHFNFMNRDIRSLVHMYLNEYGIDLDPVYQRGNVWNADQKVNLIDSVFKHIDIGKFTAIRRPFKAGVKGYEMLDGKQRLTALVEFFLGRFTYRGRTFLELHPRDQGHFMNYSVSYGESQNLTHEQKLRYFLKLNTTGTPVDPAHMKQVAKMLEEEQEKNRFKKVIKEQEKC